jgi:PAS domain S-box-containing protein
LVVDLSELLPNALLSTRADAIVAADREGVIRFWNPGAERIFGHRAADAIGQSLDLIIPERLRQRHWAGYGRTMQTGESRYGDGDMLSVPARRNDGATVSIEFTIVPLKDEAGHMVGMAAIMRDVTERFEEMRSLKRKLSGAAQGSR